MGSRGRSYITGDTEYRGLVTETGVRVIRTMIYEETEEEFAARKASLLDPNERRWAYRRRRWEDTGHEEFTTISAHGPYASETSARRSVSRLLKSGPVRRQSTDDPKVWSVTSGKVQIGTVEWRDAE